MSTADSKPDPIEHVVLLILENHSFDQMLGCFKQIYPELDGVDPNAPASNRDDTGVSFDQKPTRVRQMFEWDPRHEVDHVREQLADGNAGFVRDFARSYPLSTPPARELIMGYYPLDFLPALHALARNFTICDRWFASLPGPTWPNRFFALSGTSNGQVNMPGDETHGVDAKGYFQQTQETIFDRLNEGAIHWKVYFHDIPQTTVFTNQRMPHNSARYFYVDEFYKDAHGAEREFPQFCLIEPDFMGYEQNDAHPPHDIMRSEKLIADVYNAIRANEALWAKTLLIVVYDEHGGYFDHVVPPPAPQPDDLHTEYTFDRYGVRVPAILVSPHVKAGHLSVVFDHTSVLRYLVDKWQLEPLGRRVSAANSIVSAVETGAPREVALRRIELTPDQLKPLDPEVEEKTFGKLNVHQTALQALAAYLKTEAFEKAPRGWVTIARCVEAIKTACQAVLDRAYDEPAAFTVSIAEPDKLTPPQSTGAKDNVARFIMRKKRYAAVGLAKRITDPNLSEDQLNHAVHTLALISGRNFHDENEGDKIPSAKGWLTVATASRAPSA